MHLVALCPTCLGGFIGVKGCSAARAGAGGTSQQHPARQGQGQSGDPSAKAWTHVYIQWCWFSPNLSLSYVSGTANG